MRVYHFVNRKFGLQDIRRRRLKVARIEDLNDPFELLGPSQKDAVSRRRFARWRSDLSDYAGLLCFSRHWRNPVQWSHYADGHRGLCLGFDIPDDGPMPVGYQARRMAPNMKTLDGGGIEADLEVRRVLSTKYLHWQYEAEVRIFVGLQNADEKTGLYFVDFSSALDLKEVIVGHRSTVSRRELRRALGRAADAVDVCRARLAFGSFDVVRQRLESLWE